MALVVTAATIGLPNSWGPGAGPSREQWTPDASFHWPRPTSPLTQYRAASRLDRHTQSHSLASMSPALRCDQRIHSEDFDGQTHAILPASLFVSGNQSSPAPEFLQARELHGTDICRPPSRLMEDRSGSRCTLLLSKAKPYLCDRGQISCLSFRRINFLLTFISSVSKVLYYHCLGRQRGPRTSWY